MSNQPFIDFVAKRTRITQIDYLTKQIHSRDLYANLEARYAVFLQRIYNRMVDNA